jgi:hypothetical protein
MADVQELLEAFIAEDRGPAPADPLAYLAKADGADRAELELLIDAYLQRAPRRAVSLDGTGQPPSPAARTALERLERVYTGASGEWPVLLPQLREEAQIPRRELVARLAHQLDVADHTDQVRHYYHEMEHGLLPAAGVSDRVLAALGRLLGRSAQALRDAGRAVAPLQRPSAHASAPTFARTATPDASKAVEQPGDTTAPAEPRRTDEAVNALVDELFTGGPDAGAGA